MEIYLIVFTFIFILNVIPAFMPPTWIVLAFFYVHYHLLFLPTLLFGVTAATSGRVVLALIARSEFKRFLPHKFLKNYESLGEYLEKNQKFTIPVALGYAFSPISSNSLFIMAGLSNLDLNMITISFLVGRLFTYSFWITSSRYVSNRIDDIFIGHFSHTGTIVSAFISLLIIVVIGKINWSKILNKKG